MINNDYKDTFKIHQEKDKYIFGFRTNIKRKKIMSKIDNNIIIFGKFINNITNMEK